MHVADPVPQAVEDQATHHRVVRVQRVPGAGVVRVPRAVWLEEVVRLVVEAAERQCGALVTPFRRVVVHDVENHLDARAVQRLHEVAELVDGTQRVPTRAVPGVGGEEGNRGVPPVVEEAGRGILRIELEHGQQLDGGDPEILQIGNLLDHAGVRSARTGPDARARMPREPGDVHLVDHGRGEGLAQLGVALPVVRVGIHDHAPHGEPRVVAGPARRDAGVPVGHDDGASIRIEEGLCGIEAKPPRRIEGADRAVRVRLSRAKAGYERVPVVVRPVSPRIEANHAGRLGVAGAVEQQQLQPAGLTGEDGKIHAALHGRGPEGEAAPGRDVHVQHWRCCPRR